MKRRNFFSALLAPFVAIAAVPVIKKLSDASIIRRIWGKNAVFTHIHEGPTRTNIRVDLPLTNMSKSHIVPKHKQSPWFRDQHKMDWRKS